MLFNSYIFILFFLPLVLVLYFGLNHFGKETGAKVVLIGMSLWFYGYFHAWYLLLILVSILLSLFQNDSQAGMQYGISENYFGHWHIGEYRGDFLF